LASYFLGLGLGALLARNPVARPIARYGLLELGAAAGALWSLGILQLLAACGAGTAAAVAGVALAIVPATLCLGATLPALGQALAASAVGERGGLLYALNTFGAALGTAAMGFGLPAAIGVTSS